MSYELHEFYCMNCGNKGIDLMRKHGHQHKKFHRKKLYCIHCKKEINHIECKNEEEILEFKERFQNGEFKEEVEESMRFIEEENKGKLL